MPDLLNQINTNEKVSSRYMRHFGMTKQQVLDMVSKLKLDRLPSDGVYLVYNVPKWEEVRARALVYKKGTLVWADASGRPVLKASCGNPMVRGTDIGEAVAAPDVRLEANTAIRDLVPIASPETAFMDYETMAVAPGQLELAPAEFAPVTPAVPTVPALGFPFQIFPIIGILGILGGHDTSPPPVPEPGVTLVAGLSALAMLGRRRKSRQGPPVG